MAFVFNHHTTDKSVLEHIRKESLDIYNRLHSIAEDANFVEEVHSVYPELPILPNLRCGAWYSNPAIAKDVPAYFKSTDGHFHNWSFNLRRSNLHLVPLIEAWKGVILVDSTRSGKRIPDALSKTVPIWCAVINRAIVRRFPRSSTQEWDVSLYTPPAAVSAQEHHRIEQLLDAWADDLFKSSFQLPNLPAPLRPFWITPATTKFPTMPAPASTRALAFLPVICVSASKRVDLGTERRTIGFSYVQGSGDDHELWSKAGSLIMGLTAELFWQHKELLLLADRCDLPDMIERLVSEAEEPGSSKKAAPDPIVKIHGRLLLSALSDLQESDFRDAGQRNRSYILIDPEDLSEVAPLPTSRTVLGTDFDAAQDRDKPNKNGEYTLRLHLDSGKRGQHEFLRRILPAATERIGAWLAKGRDVCIACQTGRDTSVGVAIAAMQLYFNDDGGYLENASSSRLIDKASIRKSLEWIIASRPITNPSRATLKRVNEFLLTPSVIR